MTKQANPYKIPLPQGWPGYIKSAMLHVIAFAQFAYGVIIPPIPK